MIMCGRGTQEYSWEELHEMFGLLSEKTTEIDLKPNYNVAPTYDVVICTQNTEKRQIGKCVGASFQFGRKAYNPAIGIGLSSARLTK